MMYIFSDSVIIDKVCNNFMDDQEVLSTSDSFDNDGKVDPFSTDSVSDYEPPQHSLSSHSDENSSNGIGNIVNRLSAPVLEVINSSQAGKKRLGKDIVMKLCGAEM